MRTQRFDFGLETITRRSVDDEDHLPAEGKSAPVYLPDGLKLDEILAPPSLDERLTRLLQPEFLDPELLEPRVLSQTRQEASWIMGVCAERSSGDSKAVLDAAAKLCHGEVLLDDEVRLALAALLKG
ncbi:hypothetical protein SIAM614_00862 [Stappia aggregata IAM 12614]|uniref:Uncharacterized protein n=1 Tax=Roseibium aggregatum (strain ATCC 25650 / DSM 13394 / JCM 20685 / NBRC 16684 / NCIMB 2208 / IAM 12614 / B1) TaxID=384765 RepID=A0P2U5_ROSAI|nr:hypothetical protein [Roseibium aggregatum]EAV40748.1 hypothetical protein SIAM614_00862 [Stappia aggregata IAM 12614] [Roseibium aggregatum IAM 12614]